MTTPYNPYDVNTGWETHNLGGTVAAVRSGLSEVGKGLRHAREHLTVKQAVGTAVGAAVLAETVWHIDGLANLVRGAYELGASDIGVTDMVSSVADSVKHVASSGADATVGAAVSVAEKGVDLTIDAVSDNGEIDPLAVTGIGLGLLALKTMISPQIQRYGSRESNYEYFKWYLHDRIYCWSEGLDFKAFRKELFESLKNQNK